jgi:hypothetical protein
MHGTNWHNTICKIKKTNVLLSYYKTFVFSWYKDSYTQETFQWRSASTSLALFLLVVPLSDARLITFQQLAHKAYGSYHDFLDKW